MAHDSKHVTQKTYQHAARALLDSLAPYPLSPHARHHAKLISRFVGRPSTRALVLGASAPAMIHELSEEGAFAIGMDYSADALKRWRRELQAPLVCADLRGLPFARSSLDAVFADALLGHIEKTEFDETVRGIRDALRPGGVLGVRLKLGQGEGLAKHKGGKGEVWRTYFSREEFIEKLYALDFDLRHEQEIVAGKQMFMILRREY